MRSARAIVVTSVVACSAAAPALPALAAPPGSASASLSAVSRESSGVGSAADALGAASAAGAAAALAEGLTFQPLDQRRVLDTRSGTGAPAARVGPGGTVRLQVTGPAGSGLAHAGSAAVVLNVTATNTEGVGSVAVFPSGYALGPNLSNLTFGAGQSAANLVVSKVAADGSVTLYNAAGSVDLIADLQGSYSTDPSGATFRPLAPSRRLDTRNGTGAPAVKVGSGGTVKLQVTGPAGSGLAPAGSTAVALNVMATSPSANGHVAVYATDHMAGPDTSNLNFAAGQTARNVVISRVAPDGSVTLRNASGEVDLVVDLQGGYAAGIAGGAYRPLDPSRRLDTRTGTGAPTGKVGPAGTVRLQVTGPAGTGLAPTGSTAVLLNVTATNSSAAGTVAVYPTGYALGAKLSNLSFTAGDNVRAAVVSRVAADGSVTFANATGSVDLVADLQGAFVPGSSVTDPAVPTTAPTAPATPPAVVPEPPTTAPEPPPAAPVPPAAAPGGAVTLLAVGDIACKPGFVGPSNSCKHPQVADVVASADADWFVPLGDIQYDGASLSEFTGPGGYDESFGRFRAKTLPVLGNHEYIDPNGPAAGYWDYFNRGAAAGTFGTVGEGWYTRKLGSWRLIVLNTECAPDASNGLKFLPSGCAEGSPQYTWLQRTLSQSEERCTVVAFHRPRWTTGAHQPYGAMSAMWDLMARSGVDVTLSGHNHSNEVFQRVGVSGPGMTPTMSDSGIRSFVAGSGGRDQRPFPNPVVPALQARDSTTFGPLRLILSEGSFDWDFLPISGQAFKGDGTPTAFSGRNETCR